MYLNMRITAIFAGLTILFSIMSCVGTTYLPEPVIEGQTELHKATTRARAMKLLSKGTAINAQNAFGNTPLHEAIFF
jgi:hypothetical protein